MVIDCTQCEFRMVAFGDCLVTVLTRNNEKRTISNAGEKGNRDIGAVVVTERHPPGAQELRALGVLASAGLLAPLRYRPAQVSELEPAIVAL